MNLQKAIEILRRERAQSARMGDRDLVEALDLALGYMDPGSGSVCRNCLMQWQFHGGDDCACDNFEASP